MLEVKMDLKTLAWYDTPLGFPIIDSGPPH